MLLVPALTFYQHHFGPETGAALNLSGAVGRNAHAVSGNSKLSNTHTGPRVAPESASPAPLFSENIVLQDDLLQSTRGKRFGGRFVAGGGWQTASEADMIVYDLGRYIEDGSLEIEVSNFRPSEQNTMERHHFLSMFRNPWGNHHLVEYLATVWDMHTGFNYDTGVKLLSLTFDTPEQNTVVFDDWDRNKTYRLKLVWKNRKISYFRDNALQAMHTHDDDMQLRFVFLGRDFTTSGDLITGYKHNQYPALIGPIYANLVVKENISAADRLPPQIQNPTAADIYTNAARLAWTTDEPSVCFVEYGKADQYGESTPVLGPPAQTFSTSLANLAPNQEYHYRIVARDKSGNVTASADQTFFTTANGLYLFKPMADTFVEQSGLYGPTREHANFGWMSLLASAGRECYWRFQVAGVGGEVRQATLRLHGRQSGNAGGTLHVLTGAWEENEVTWLTKPNITGKQLGKIDSVRAGAWQEVAIDSAVSGNGVYEFALIGYGNATISWDSRESTNCQPELIITAGAPEEPPPIMLADSFNAGAMDAGKWRVGANSGNQTTVSDSALALRSLGLESGWVITRHAYPARHTAAIVKVRQANNDGDLGISPTYNLASPYGIYDQANWYRFYVYRNVPSGPYHLYVEWRKNGDGSGLDVTGNMNIDSTAFLRLRFDDSKIHFEASLDGEHWSEAYSEVFALPGYSVDSFFYYELAAYNTESSGALMVDDFWIKYDKDGRFATRVDDGRSTAAQKPATFALQNYPNPFNAATRISVSLPQPAEIHLTLFDLTGREVKSLLQQSFPAGQYVAIWDGRNHDGEELRSGIYLLRLRYRTEKSRAWSQTVRRVLMVR